MFCPKCAQPNPPHAETCGKCKQNTSYFRDRLFVGRQFIFVQADDQHPMALKVDDAVQIFHSSTILSRHRHAVSFGDKPPAEAKGLGQILLARTRKQTDSQEKSSLVRPLPDQPRLPLPSLDLLTMVTDRKIYAPDDEATLFIVAPDASGDVASLEIQLAGQKIYEADVTLNQDGLALHRYLDLKEGEYTAVVTMPDQARAECKFSVAEFTLSPLVAILQEHEYTEGRLVFSLNLLLLSIPYSGPVEFGLQCQVCGDRVVATQQADAIDGIAHGEFDLSRHGGPFHVQVTTPDGGTALVSFPGTGAMEREHISINPLGQTVDMGLLPWEETRPLRGFYIGSGEVSMTPLMLESVHAGTGRLKIAADIVQAKMNTFDPRSGTTRVIEWAHLKRGETVEFDVDAPYTMFTVGAFTQNQPFEGWGVVIKPVAFDAELAAPDTARPGEEIDVHLGVTTSSPIGGGGSVEESPVPAFCWLLAYDARLEHESPVPRLAKNIYESVRDFTHNLGAELVPNAHDQQWSLPASFVGENFLSAGAGVLRAVRSPDPGLGFPFAAAAPQSKSVGALSALPVTSVEMPAMVVAPTRMEFPELVYNELFYLEGNASRTVKLGDQIGTWRVRAYLFHGGDYRELTSDVQADKPLYAELDLPAIASAGDEIAAAVNYNTREPAELVIATPFGETRLQVSGSGREGVTIKGPGRVEVRLENPGGSDWTVRDVAPPGVQRVTASRLMLLDQGQTARGEKVAIYASMGQVLKDTITALIGYPFG